MDAFSRNISDIMKSGGLVDDQIVVDIVRQLMLNREEFLNGEFSSSPGIILDGVPRTVKQAEMISNFSQVDLILNFYNRDDVLLQKLMGRRVCPECNKNFNVADVNTEDGYQMEALLPTGADPTVCDGDHAPGIQLVTREDDKEEIILERLNLYKEETLPILEFYQRNTDTPVIDFEAKKGKKDYPILKELLENHLYADILPETVIEDVEKAQEIKI